MTLAYFLVFFSGSQVFGGDLQKAAQDAVAAKHFLQARELYVQLSELEPANLDYLLWIGRLSGWLKEYPAATSAYDRALALDPLNLDALVGKAYALLWQRDFPPARALLVQAERLAPNNAEVELAWARYYHYQGREKLAQTHVLRVCGIDPANEEAQELKSQISIPHPVEVTIGYGYDNFSFASAGNMGYARLGYVGDLTLISIQYEQWNRFGQHVNRPGLSFSRRFRERWWLRGAAVWAPGATVLPEQDYTAGFSRSFLQAAVLGADYRYLRFVTARVNVLSPSFEYYLKKPVWLRAAYYRSWTAFRSITSLDSANNSFLVQYNQQATKWLVAHLGYARGNESFLNLSIDRLGKFQANTYIAGLEFKLSPTLSLGPSYEYQRRLDGAQQKSFGISLTIRE